MILDTSKAPTGKLMTVLLLAELKKPNAARPFVPLLPIFIAIKITIFKNQVVAVAERPSKLIRATN